MARSNQQMSNPDPHEPLTRNPNTGPREKHPDGTPGTEKPAGLSIPPTDTQASDDEDIVGPDRDRG